MDSLADADAQRPDGGADPCAQHVLFVQSQNAAVRAPTSGSTTILTDSDRLMAAQMQIGLFCPSLQVALDSAIACHLILKW